MRLVFFGSGAFGLPTLASLASGHDLLAVVTQPDRPAGRGGKMTPTPIAAWMQDHHPKIPLLKPERVNEPAVAAQLRALEAQAWVVIAYGQKLGRLLLEGRFAINLHASLLPRWRGAAPINAAILAGDAMTGNSVITLADRMDAGEILGQSRRPIDPNLTAGELHDLLAADGPALIGRVLDQAEHGALSPVRQDEMLATLAPKLGKQDGRVDFSRPASECRRRVHALTPWPGVSVLFRGETLKLLRVSDEIGNVQASPGELTDPQAGLIACEEGSVLRLIEVQPAGKRPMPWADFARGRAPRAGERFEAGASPC